MSGLTRGRFQLYLTPQHPGKIVFSLNLCQQSLSAHLNDDDKCRLKKGGVCLWVQDRCTGLEWLKEPADIPTKREIIAEKYLFNLRDSDGPFSKIRWQTRLDRAALNKTRRVSSWGPLSPTPPASTSLRYDIPVRLSHNLVIVTTFYADTRLNWKLVFDYTLR